MASIYGLEFDDFEPDELPMGAVLIVKYLDDTGEATVWYQHVDVSPFEAIGMAMAYADRLRDDLVMRRNDVDDDD